MKINSVLRCNTTTSKNVIITSTIKRGIEKDNNFCQILTMLYPGSGLAHSYSQSGHAFQHQELPPDPRSHTYQIICFVCKELAKPNQEHSLHYGGVVLPQLQGILQTGPSEVKKPTLCVQEQQQVCLFLLNVGLLNLFCWQCHTTCPLSLRQWR